MGVKIGIRGMGLIGGSFEKAFKKAGHEVVDLKDNNKAIPECEVIIVCLPPLMVSPWIKEHAALFSTGAIVTDAAGVKGEVCSAIREVARGESWSFIGGHPMAAGLSIPEENILLFRECMNANTTLTEADLTPKVRIDVPMPMDYVTDELVYELDILAPFGKNNTKPVFADKNIDTLVLGCTHYPFLNDIIKKIAKNKFKE